MRRARLAVAVLACAAMLVGCGPSEKEISKVSQTHESQVKATADLIVTTVIAQNPDVKTQVDYVPERDEGWSDCYDGSRPTDEMPETVQWSSDRVVYMKELKETDSLVDPLIKAFLDDGWAHPHTSRNKFIYGVTISKGDYTMTVGGNSDADPTYLSQIGIKVNSACSSPPASILDWKPGKADPTPGS